MADYHAQDSRYGDRRRRTNDRYGNSRRSEFSDRRGGEEYRDSRGQRDYHDNDRRYEDRPRRGGYHDDHNYRRQSDYYGRRRGAQRYSDETHYDRQINNSYSQDSGSRADGHNQRGRSSTRRRHAQRAGVGRRSEDFRTGPRRSNFREERTRNRQNEPQLPADLTSHDLDPSVLQDLRSLAKDNAETVGRHLIMAATLMQEDPNLALQHARAAKNRAGRVSVVRETCGIAAYHAGEWKEALSELRAARRISGGPGLLAVMADCERGMGHPEKAVELARSEESSLLDHESQVELAIVVAGARQDMGQYDAAVAAVQPYLNKKSTGLSASRLFYAHADALVAAGRIVEAREWFERAAAVDEDGFLDAEERLAEL